MQTVAQCDSLSSESVREKRSLSSVCVTFSESRIRYDHYLIPFTLYELGLLYKQQGDFTKATTYIENAK